MKKILAVIFIILAGCGYTSRGFLYEETTIYIAPVKNNIKIAQESRKYTNYISYPALIEKKLTNALIRDFQIDGHLEVINSQAGSLNLTVEITDYKKETLRYTDNDDIKEQRLWLIAQMTLSDKGANILKQREIKGETTFFLIGSEQKSEGEAQTDLVSDTARRILEAVIEEW